MAEATLTAEDALFIYRALQDGESQALLARDFDVTPQSISAIKTGKAWSHVTGQKFVSNPRRKLTVDDVLAIDAGLRAGVRNQKLAEDFEISNQLISNIRRGRDWTWVTGRTPNNRRKRND